MEDDAPVIYGLEFQARALTAQTAETDAIRFLVGTQSLKFDNQIHIIDFDDENNMINKSVLLHDAGEIWHISGSPADKAVLTTCYNKTSESRVLTCAAVWRMPPEWESGSHESPDDSSNNPQTLELLCHLDNTAHGSVAWWKQGHRDIRLCERTEGGKWGLVVDVWCTELVADGHYLISEKGGKFLSSQRDSGKTKATNVLWEPMGDGKRVISLAENHVLLWDLQESSSKATISSSATLEGKGQLKFTTGKWSPHHNSTQLATANDTAIRGWDLRSMSQIYCIENAHGQLVRDLDFNPNKQYYLASCGDDCKVKFWDVRHISEPVKSLEEHSHWVWSVRYNHSHDQLLLTGSSDSRVILSNMVSISSEPFGHLVDDDDLSDNEENQQEDKGKEPLQDSIIATYEEHEDSVYAVEWSAADPWLFASLSYDGRLVINRVPRALKYRILL
ncbi:Protein TSSC1 [Anabarilius grahami]|uniref:Protein TSSC1 n=1 Tax=Anabarilius grahami TaxID=495550 RepID=A0A3N0YFD2_ANAGA|nr:Protein TSSC1 [Anabarilius grahami]